MISLVWLDLCSTFLVECMFSLVWLDLCSIFFVMHIINLVWLDLCFFHFLLLPTSLRNVKIELQANSGSDGSKWKWQKYTAGCPGWQTVEVHQTGRTGIMRHQSCGYLSLLFPECSETFHSQWELFLQFPKK
jgi:hypothetical protein